MRKKGKTFFLTINYFEHSLCLPVGQSIRLSVFLYSDNTRSVCPSFCSCLSVCLLGCRSVSLLVSLSVSLSVRFLLVFMSICRYLCQSVSISVCLCEIYDD